MSGIYCLKIVPIKGKILNPVAKNATAYTYFCRKLKKLLNFTTMMAQ